MKFFKERIDDEINEILTITTMLTMMLLCKSAQVCMFMMELSRKLIQCPTQEWKKIGVRNRASENNQGKNWWLRWIMGKRCYQFEWVNGINTLYIIPMFLLVQCIRCRKMQTSEYIFFPPPPGLKNCWFSSPFSTTLEFLGLLIKICVDVKRYHF